MDWFSLLSQYGGTAASALSKKQSPQPIATDVGYSPDSEYGSTGATAEGVGPATGTVAGGRPSLGSLMASPQGGELTTGGSKDPTGESILAPERAKRERILGLLPMTTDIGSGIQPVATTRGGQAMAGAAATERAGRMNAEYGHTLSDLSTDLRKNAALGNTVQQGVGLIKDLVTKYYTGGFGGGGGGGGMGGMGGMMGMFGGGGGG